MPFSIEALRHRLRALGAGPGHEASVLRHWLQAKPQLPRSPREAILPAPLRAALPAIEAELASLARVRSAHPAEDGAERLLVQLADGETIESVLLPPTEGRGPGGPMGGLCVSTQVGCAVGCGFCMTGQGGLRRHLTSAEIAAQLALARARRAVRKVVFMGMGEPAHNLDAVLEAIEAMGTAGGIGHKELVFSTVGDPRAFDRLDAIPPGRVRPALALSLHSTNAARRAELLPRAPQLEPQVLVDRACAYADASGYPLQVQWTLIEGVNDGDDELDGLVRLLAGRRVVLNLIPYNAVPGLAFARPPAERAAELARRLHRAGVLTKLRRSAGQDVDAGCGQLRARSDVVRIARTARQAAAAHPGRQDGLARPVHEAAADSQRGGARYQ
ncbi:MAG TPA: RNA methyltransferase [Methylibium sp.]|uniref:RNA methyltransferase n=1 Tax=Methylibium sp. TaxID=2067992 RepID=UPI002DB566BF|nr:RNA methyltransferase [Methylibium sp.]HEU4460466.1 RNA methyltransferase [Methylibium sp.]